MPLDAICLRCVRRELEKSILNTRIEKIQQPARDQLVFQMKGGVRLYLNGGTSQSRIQMTEEKRENPAVPPMFCVLLRKHLTGGIIRAIEQPPMERILRLRIDAVDELGIRGERSLVLETMGRRSNLLLLDEEDVIIDCLRKVDFSVSAERQILPGMRYLPPKNVKKNISEEEITDLQKNDTERQLSDVLLDYAGISPLIAREIAFCVGGDTEIRMSSLSKEERETLSTLLNSMTDEKAEFSPYLLTRDGEAFDYTFMPILQYGIGVRSTKMESFSQLFDVFYREKEQRERVRQKGQDLLRAAENVRDRIRRKLEKQRLDYRETEGREEYRKCGELITANLYRMKKGESVLACEDYYASEPTEIKIKLDPLLTPQQNAAKYYKTYQKLKNAREHLKIWIAKGEEELCYAESILEEINRAESEQDFWEIRNEMLREGYLRAGKNDRKQIKRPSLYREFISRNGLPILAGRNNVQNDRLTFSDADKRDLWFHVQKLHGAHVVLKNTELATEEDLCDAATVAAYFSEAKESGKVAVDYTEIRYVKKPSGAKAGRAIYTHQHTLYVTPKKVMDEK